jgi:hypothetical protein
MTDSLPTPIAPSEIDTHGHDINAYDWVPVLKKRRSDGWSPQKQREFIEALADTGSVSDAARSVRVSTTSCYRLRRAPGAEGFAAAWDAALEEASKRLVDIAFDRAFNGTYEPIINQNGNNVGARIRYSDRLLMFLLRAHRPDRYDFNRPAGLRKSLAAAAASNPVSEAIKLLDPVQPPEPHRLMEPLQLEDALLCADILDGKLPAWRRDPEERRLPLPTEDDLEFEAELEAIKHRTHYNPAPDDDD